MMKLGIINNRPNEENLEYVKSLGLSFIEICNNDNNDSKWCSENISSINELVKNKGLFIGSVGRWNSVMNSAGKINESEFYIVAQNLKDAIAVKSPTFVVGCNYDDSVSLYKNYGVAIEIFGRLLDIARGSGTNIGVYNCDWNNFVNNSEAWKIVLGELPELKIKFDASHSYNAGRDFMKEISDWADRFAHMHVKGTVRTHGRVVADPPAGMDDFSWGSIFAILYDRGYDGCLSIEPHSSAWQFDTERGQAGVRFTVDYISKFIM